MIKITYNKLGVPFSDFGAEDFVKNLINEDTLNTETVVSTENILFAVRVAVYEGNIDFTKVSFVINNDVYLLNKYGKMYAKNGTNNIPDMFFDNMLDRLLGLN